MKLTTIIASTLGVGLLSLTSFAIAQDKYTARFPVKGVDSNPTFGMTESEKQEYLDNVEMCEEQYNGWETGYSRYTNRTYVYARNQHYHTTYELYVNGEKVLGFADSRKAPHRQDVTDIHREVVPEYTDLYRVGDLKSSGSSAGFYAWSYEIIYLNKTDNYDWCKENGFKTAN